MSYQAAGFNPNQTAIRSVQPQAAGANDAAATAPVYQPIRYANDLQAAQAQPETVNTATHTADAIVASATATAAVGGAGAVGHAVADFGDGAGVCALHHPAAGAGGGFIARGGAGRFERRAAGARQ